MKVRTIAAVGLALGMASAAQGEEPGGWQFAKWGMSRDAVISAGGEAVRSLSDSESKAVSTFVGTSCTVQMDTAPLVGGVRPEHVVFCFDPQDRLSSIDMRFPGEDFHALDRALASRFGQPAKSEGGSMPERIYNGQGNSMRLLRVVGTILSYTPQASGF